ncbi:hypothetical protein KR084_005761, partial [Drosophila pseudotakahashii]
MCVDYRQLNARPIPDAYPLPRINHILERLRNATFISTLDLTNGYWQIPMALNSRESTAFTVPGRGLYQWRVMPFGLHSAPATFQRALDSVISPDMEPYAFAYLDDIIVIGASLEDHMTNLCQVFKRLREENLRINQEKCSFFQQKLTYLGHVISNQGIHTDPEKRITTYNHQCKWIQRKLQEIKDNPQKVPDYVVENGELYRHLGHRPDDQDYIPWKLCVPGEHRQRILQECHDAPTA